MKNHKRPTRAQKEIISNSYLNPKNWLIVHESEFYLKIIHKESGKLKNINKYGNKKCASGYQPKSTKTK